MAISTFKNLLPAFTLLYLFTISAVAQQPLQVKGRVSEAESGQPLAFVHVVVPESLQGTMTDIDGFFSLTVPHGQEYLQLSYVGYFGQIFEIDFGKSFQQIAMYRRPYQLEEVVVYPGENPAHRIILNTISNRNTNDPGRLNAFTYKSYNKFLATLDRDFYMERWLMTGDSANYRMADMLDKRHIFIMESLTERRFRSPDLNNEKVIANRVSGLENPMFTMLATELQSFSFYGNSITLLENDYLSPLNRAAFSRYFYHLEDTLYQGADTVFVVAFRPVRNTNFDGLKGLLYINSHGWAVQSVIAQPAREMGGGMNFKIQQMYEQVDGKHWFPVQLNTDIDFFNPQANDPTAMIPLRMLGRSYIREIEINPALRRRDFSNFTIEFNPEANRLPRHFWDEFRADSLSYREQNTYRFMDSLGRKHNFDRIVNLIEPLIFGEIPLGSINIPLNSLYRYNDFEGHRFGLGISTNQRFSERFRTGGHYAWSTRDRTEKYGYFGEIVLQKNRDLRVGGSFRFDVNERGGNKLMRQHFLLSPNLIRNLFMNKMDYTQRTSAYLSFLAYRNFLTTEIAASRGKTSWTDMYYFTQGDNEPGLRSFRFSEINLRMRFAYGETLMKTQSRLLRLPSEYPVLYLNISKGFDNIDRGELNYLKLEAAVETSYSIPLLGKQTWLIEGGWTDRPDLPWPLLFTAKSGNRNYFLASPFSFGTMHMSEFAANRFAAVFFQHNFQNLLFRWPRYEPELVLITSAGVGSLEAKENHIFMEARSWDKGYFESGIAINKILPQRWSRRIVFGMSPGIEVLYRYGPYSLPKTSDNFTIKLSMITSF